MNAREFFVQRHEDAERDAARYIKTDAEKEGRTVLRALAEFCMGEVDLSSVVFEDGVVIFPDGLRLSFYREYGEDSHDAFRVQGQCPLCGETCWSGACFAPYGVGEMLAAFSPQGHRCLVPDERRPISVGDVVTVWINLGEEEINLRGVKVLTTPLNGRDCWQFISGDVVRAVGAGTQFLITRKGRKGQ